MKRDAALSTADRHTVSTLVGIQPAVVITLVELRLA
jgi:hypothetical protein